MPDGFDGFEKDRDDTPSGNGLRVIDPDAVRRRHGSKALADAPARAKPPRLRLVPPAVSKNAVSTPFSDGADLVDLEDLPPACKE